MTEVDPNGGLAKFLEDYRKKQSEVAEASAVLRSLTAAPELESVAVEPPKPGWKKSESWIVVLMPVIIGAVVQLGWLSEDAATRLGVTGVGAYAIGRSIVAAVVEWRK